VAHERQFYREFLARLPAHSAIAVEASGRYSWLVDEVERADHRPGCAIRMRLNGRMGLTNKNDKLGARGAGNPASRRHVAGKSGYRRASCAISELLRLRIFLVRLRTRVKNRSHGTLSRRERSRWRYSAIALSRSRFVCSSAARF
jgi:transposase